MKAKKLRTIVVAVFAAGIVSPIFAQAESLESLQEQESAVMQQSQEISTEVQIALTDVNAKYSEVEELKAQIAENEESLATTKAEIKTAQETIEKREAVVAERMKDIQVNGGATRDWTVLLESSNIQDFINRAYAMTMLQNLEKEKIDSLTAEKEKQEALEEKAQSTQQSLKENHTALESEANTLDSKIANLPAHVKENEATNNLTNANLSFQTNYSITSNKNDDEVATKVDPLITLLISFVVALIAVSLIYMFYKKYNKKA